MIDVVTATVSGREADLERWTDSLTANTAKDVLTFINVKDEETCGVAWLKGLELSNAPYVLLGCDDLEMTSPTWAGACVEATDRGHLPCPVIHRPNGSLESCGGDMNSPACLISEMQPEGTEVDFTPLPFMSREQVDRIGMIPAHYMTDVYVSHKGRQLGYPTKVVHGFQMTHYHSNVKRRTPTADDTRLYSEALTDG